MSVNGGPNPAAHKDVHAPKRFLMCAEKLDLHCIENLGNQLQMHHYKNKVFCIQKSKMIQDAFLQTQAVGSDFEPKVRTYHLYKNINIPLTHTHVKQRGTLLVAFATSALRGHRAQK